ncbi:MAG: hypothetical protein DMG38_20985 [Acidobacteria bacterium]|nr:MAG: hypothetical protein DMG38_20985 [Acidobacteriota bacterium]
MKSVPRLLLRRASPRMDLQASTSKMAIQASRKTWRPYYAEASDIMKRLEQARRLPALVQN